MFSRNSLRLKNCFSRYITFVKNCVFFSTMSTEEHDISWAMKLLEREATNKPNILSRNWNYICAPIFGISVPMGMNFWLNRPLLAGIHRHFIFGILGFAVGHFLTEREKFVLARRDAIMRDYIRLHPQDFPAPEVRKIRDIFEPWVPVR